MKYEHINKLYEKSHIFLKCKMMWIKLYNNILLKLLFCYLKTKLISINSDVKTHCSNSTEFLTSSVWLRKLFYNTFKMYQIHIFCIWKIKLFHFFFTKKPDIKFHFILQIQSKLSNVIKSSSFCLKLNYNAIIQM